MAVLARLNDCSGPDGVGTRQACAQCLKKERLSLTQTAYCINIVGCKELLPACFVWGIMMWLSRWCDSDYRASGVKLVLCGHGKGRRDLSAEHSMRITDGYGGPARGQARELQRSPWPVTVTTLACAADALVAASDLRRVGARAGPGVGLGMMNAMWWRCLVMNQSAKNDS